MFCVYDSGVGGLTALRALRAAKPECDILYLGDTARVPYGTRSDAAVCRFAGAALTFLAGKGPSAVLIACGTVSTVYLPTLSGAYPFPVFGVADAGVRAALAAAPHGRIAVLGTEATVRSGYFAARIRAVRRDAEVRSIACPIFVSLAECGMTAPEDPIPALAAERMLSPLIGWRPEALILGCTHFPWLAAHIARLFPGAALIDCGAAAVTAHLSALDGGGLGRTEYFVTDDPTGFARTAARMMGRPPDGPVQGITLPI